jgi:hypothetical protein
MQLGNGLRSAPRPFLMANRILAAQGLNSIVVDLGIHLEMKGICLLLTFDLGSRFIVIVQVNSASAFGFGFVVDDLAQLIDKALLF